MDEYLATENKKQMRQKPPLSWRRIAGEILAGTATAFVSVPVLYASGAIVLFSGPGHDYTGSVGQLHLFGDLAMFIFLFPVVSGLYGLASALGVYLVGSGGKQTGSLLATFGCGFLAAGVTLFVFPFAFSSHLIGVEKIVLGAVVLLTAPIMATLGFNLTRKYKQPPSS